MVSTYLIQDTGPGSGAWRIRHSPLPVLENRGALQTIHPRFALEEPMQFIDLAAQQARIREDLEKRIHAVMDHGRYINGPEVGELEKALAGFCGASHGIGCSSGTEALLLALMAYGVGPGHTVLTTPFTFIATAEVIALLGATPVFVDIDPETFNIDCDRPGTRHPDPGQRQGGRPSPALSLRPGHRGKNFPVPKDLPAQARGYHPRGPFRPSCGL